MFPIKEANPVLDGAHDGRWFSPELYPVLQHLAKEGINPGTLLTDEPLFFPGEAQNTIFAIMQNPAFVTGMESGLSEPAETPDQKDLENLFRILRIQTRDAEYQRLSQEYGYQRELLEHLVAANTHGFGLGLTDFAAVSQDIFVTFDGSIHSKLVGVSRTSFTQPVVYSSGKATVLGILEILEDANLTQSYRFPGMRIGANVDMMAMTTTLPPLTPKDELMTKIVTQYQEALRVERSRG